MVDNVASNVPGPTTAGDDVDPRRVGPRLARDGVSDGLGDEAGAPQRVHGAHGEQAEECVLNDAVDQGLTIVPFFSLNSVGVTCHAYLLETEGLFTEGSRPVGLSASLSVRISKWTVLIARTGLGTISLIPDPTLSLT